MTPEEMARREAARLRATGRRIPQVDDWRCYRCGEWRAHDYSSEEVETAAGWTVRVCWPRCEL